jgi:hydrogenase maturation protease
VTDSQPASLIIGYGNAIRSDDGTGLKAAAAIEREACLAGARVIAAHQLVPEMAEPVARADRVLFLDASHAGAPGEIRCERTHRDREFQLAALSHDLSPGALLELAARHFQAEPATWLLTITGSNFDLGESFSPPVEAAWKAYLERVLAWVRVA